MHLICSSPSIPAEDRCAAAPAQQECVELGRDKCRLIEAFLLEFCTDFGQITIREYDIRDIRDIRDDIRVFAIFANIREYSRIFVDIRYYSLLFANIKITIRDTSSRKVLL